MSIKHIAISALLIGLGYTTACGNDDVGTGGAGGIGQTQQAITQCVTIQRGVFGTVNDAELTSNTTWQQGGQPNFRTGKSGSVTSRSVLKFDLSSIPANAIVSSADVSLYVGAPQAMAMKAHRVTSTWAENTVIWNNQPTFDSAASIGTLSRPAGSYGVYSFSVLAQVQNWIAGTHTNYGMMLEQDTATSLTTYNASESGSSRPKLVVCYDTGSTSSTTASSTTSSTAASTVASTSVSTTAASTTVASSSAESSSASSTASASSSSAEASSSSASSSASSSSSGGGADVVVHIAVLGDYGAEGDGLTGVANMVANWNPDYVITTGDNHYSSSDNYDTITGKYFHQFIYPYSGTFGSGSPTGTNRFYPIAGNHDWDHQNLGSYMSFFTLPNNERYYDVQLGTTNAVHFYALDADDREPDGNTSTSVQAQWLENKLNTTSACFKIINEHEPGFCSTIAQSEGAFYAMRWDFQAMGADIVMSGSRHGYERLSVNGFPYIVNGASGASRWGDWNIIDPNSVYRFPLNPVVYGAQLITVTISNGIGTLKNEFWGVGASSPADTLIITKNCQ
jgi:hypothetical protein